MYTFNINNFENNQNVIDCFLIKSVNMEKTKTNASFLSITLSNKFGDVNCKLWDSNDEDYTFFKQNKTVKVMGVVNEYKGNKQLIIKKFKSSDDKDLIDITQLLEMSKIDIDTEFNNLINIISDFENQTLKLLTLTIIQDNEQIIKKASAAKIHHHNIVGGWLEHTITMLNNAMNLVNSYNNINTNLLYSGIILHDIGKLREFEYDEYGIVKQYSVAGELIGHITLGIQIVTEYFIKLQYNNKQLDNNILILLNHLIISHHGTPEFGSCKYPMIKEAEILSSLDMLDTKLYMFDKITNEVKQGEFSTRQWSLNNRKIYNV